jgi:predicted tellurium resistance membrane protein TerC
LLLAISWVIGLNKPVLNINDFALSFRDLILIAGGLFLVAKSTSEIHAKIQPAQGDEKKVKELTVRGAIIQITILDLVFSLDSIITAVGLVDEMVIIILSIVIAMAIMLAFSRKISMFIDKNPAMKLLALSFLLMIGSVLIIEGLHVHVPKGYIYFSMAFALGIELINLKIRKKNPIVIH